MSNIHIPVLKDEAIEGLKVISGGTYIDATLGAGGHAKEIIRAGGKLLGIDQDTDALAVAKENLKGLDAVIVQGNFRDIANIASTNGFSQVDGVLFDLGVSSIQLDSVERGLSFRFTDAPLDLRMNARHGDTAAQLVNRATEEELYDIFSVLGEEQLARRIARAVYRTRSVSQVQKVGDLVGIIANIVPNEIARQGVLARVFQGLRIAVNDELGSLKAGLNGAQMLLKPGGRLVVISFHSLEDRIVKLFMKGEGWNMLTHHPIRPTEEEICTNRRSRSAKLRIAERD